MLTPRDPDAFRSDVLRRAMRIERRRRRARALMAAPAVVAVLLLAVVIQQRDPQPADIAAGSGEGVVRVEEVPLPDGAAPWSVVVGSDQAVWTLSREPAPVVVRLGHDGEISTIALGDGAEPDALVAGTDDGVWATDPANRRVIRLGADGDVTSWTTEASPSASATWTGGRLWFAEPALDRITGIATDGDLVHLAVPDGRAPAIVAAGPDGAVWYASSTSSMIGSVSPTGAVNELDLGGERGDRVTAMTTGPGPSLWLLVHTATRPRLARVDTQGHVVGDDLVTTLEPIAITPGPNGRLWFTTGDGTIQQQSTSKISIVPLGRPFDAASWALAGDDSMWAVDRMRHSLVRIDAG